MPDLNKMSLDDVLMYCQQHEKWLIDLFIGNEGYKNAVEILRDNGKI